jgi:hypothetical protein
LVAFGTMAARFRETAHRTVMKPKRKKPLPSDPGNIPAEFQRMLDEDPDFCMATVKTAEKIFAEKKAGMTPAKLRESRALLRKLRSEMSYKAARIMVNRLADEMKLREGHGFSPLNTRLYIRKALVTFRSAEKLLRHVCGAERLKGLAIIEFFRGLCRGVLRAIQSGRPFDPAIDLTDDGSPPRRSRKTPRRPPPA